MTKKRLIALLLAAVMVFALAACGGSTTETQAPADDGGETPATETPAEVVAPEPEDDRVLVIGQPNEFSQKWNPFLAENTGDVDTLKQIFVPITQADENNEMQPFGGNVTSEELESGNILYTVTINEGMTFTDGTPITIDDYIYGIYVRSDPSFTGPANTWSSKILGIQEYLYDTPDYSATVDGFEAQAASFEMFLEYSYETDLEGWWDGGEWADEDYTWIDYITDEGYEAELAEIDETDTDAVFQLVAKIEYETYGEYYGAYDWALNKLQSDFALGNLEGGVSVPEIEGVKKINDLTCTVEYTEVNIIADRELTMYNGLGWLAPKHYYGDYEKGDVSAILSNMEPMGSGAYVWAGFADNIVTLVANNDFFLGKPATQTVRMQYVPDSEILELLAAGYIDISEPSASKKNVEEMQNLGLTYELMDNDGYGYLGFNCNNVSLNVRKGLVSIMNRDPSVEGYYGTELATVIERPMTTVLAEYPQDVTRMYEYSPEKALEYFAMDGYTQKDGKLVNEAGEQLVVNVYIGGEGEGNHPGYAMLVQAAEDLAALGGELQIQDVSFGVIMATKEDGTADMFVMAWGGIDNPDKSTQWRSDGGQNVNSYRINDAELDALLDKIVQTIDFTERKALVGEMLDVAMDLCFEYPLYQRNNVVAYNADNVNMDTVCTATTFHRFWDQMWTIEVYQ